MLVKRNGLSYQADDRRFLADSPGPRIRVKSQRYEARDRLNQDDACSLTARSWGAAVTAPLHTARKKGAGRGLPAAGPGDVRGPSLKYGGPRSRARRGRVVEARLRRGRDFGARAG